MPLTLGEDSYVTLTEATDYFATRLDAAAWLDASEAMRESALITATQVFENKEWTGVVVAVDQSLAFPRTGSYFDPRLGVSTKLDDVLYPVRLKKAQMELAYHLLNNDGLLDETGGIADLKVASIYLRDLETPNLIPSNVYNLIKPLLLNSSSQTWWRAN